jgi:hypothetical protein
MAISANLAKDLKLTRINVKLNLDNRLKLVMVLRIIKMNIVGKGQNYENHNVENQKEHRKIWRRSLHRKWLFS